MQITLPLYSPRLNLKDELRKAKGLTPVQPRSEFEIRIKRCKELMKERGFDALLVYGAPYEPE